MKKRLFTLCFALTAVCASTMAQVEINETNFPDAKFRSLVSKNIDTNKNGKLDESEINADAAKELNVSNQGIKDLTGIQYFTNLKSLYCYGNEISGANMYKLVNLLPAPSSTLGGLAINYNGCTPDNVITKAQEKIAEEKGWLVVRCLNDEDFELYDGEDLTITAKFFPDAKFRGLVTVYDTDNDNILSDTELGKVYEINASGKGITDLTGIEHFYALQTLYCNNNSLTALDVWNNKVLETLDCSKNNLTALDLTNNEDLMWVACYGNNISGTAMDRLVASLHQVSYEAPGYGDLVVCSDQCARDNTITKAQIMTIMEKDWKAWQYVGSDLADMLIKISVAFDSDANFRAYVASNIDTDGDGYLSIAERKAVTTIDVAKGDIKDLSDVKYFMELTELNCTDNNLTKLNVTANKKLKYLLCSGNNLTSLDVSKNTALTWLYCMSNSLKSLDVSKNTALMTLYCYSNSLESLDVSKNAKLKYLYCYYNSLESLDVSNNKKLTKLNCSWNILKSLDVSKNTALTELYCNGNSLTSLTVSGATALTRLECQNNNLQTLDVSNTALTSLNCYANQIKGAAMDNLVNGLPNTGGTLYVCKKDAANDNVITASQVRVATDKGWKVKRDEGSSWVDYAGVFEPIAIDETNFPDPKFRAYLLTQDFGKDAVLTEDEMLAVTELNVSGRGIKDMKGIEHFTALTTLNCSWNNNLTTLDISKNTALKALDCWGNNLQSLDVSKNTALTRLDCSHNSLSSLDVSKNTALTDLRCSSNSLESLDVSKNTALTTLYCSNNSLTSLDVSKNTALTHLSCSENSLTSLDVSNNTALTKLVCYGNNIKGTSMDNLVKSLPKVEDGLFDVVAESQFPDNSITAAQVKVATDKGWKVYKDYGNGYEAYAGLGDVNNNNKINQDDLDLLVQIVMGQQPAYVDVLSGDLNNDGKVDAADIVTLVNILNGK